MYILTIQQPCKANYGMCWDQFWSAMVVSWNDGNRIRTHGRILYSQLPPRRYYLCHSHGSARLNPVLWISLYGSILTIMSIYRAKLTSETRIFTNGQAEYISFEAYPQLKIVFIVVHPLYPVVPGNVFFEKSTPSRSTIFHFAGSWDFYRTWNGRNDRNERTSPPRSRTLKSTIYSST